MNTPTARLLAQHNRINDLCDNIERSLETRGSSRTNGHHDDEPCRGCDQFHPPADLDDRWHCPACAREYVRWLADAAARTPR